MLDRPFWTDSTGLVDLYAGDVLDVLRCLPSASVQCCVTSPPYYALRDYQVAGQIGLEATPEEYVAKLVAVFAEVRRVLRDDGVLFLNIGDSYYSSGKGQNGDGSHNPSTGKKQATNKGAITGGLPTHMPPGMKPKDLIGIPWMLAFALRADGWYLRSDIIWHKPNPMPESITDRPTKSHEYLFLLTKSRTYYYDAAAVREPHQDPNADRYFGGGTSGAGVNAPDWQPREKDGLARPEFRMKSKDYNPSGRNRRTVWTIATQSYEGAHFATFPEALVEPCILAGTSERGCCPACGAPWRRVVSRETDTYNDKEGVAQRLRNAGASTGGTARVTLGVTEFVSRSTLGWEQGCTCPPAEPVSCAVLDPFIGSGTTAMVAKRLMRRGIGIDLNPDYLKLAITRVGSVTPGIQEVLPLW